MKVIVVYSSKSGNTKKIADEIASELNCGLFKLTSGDSIPNIDLDNYDLIFIGTGIHFGNPNEDIVGYFKMADLKKPKAIALFITWGGAGKTIQDVCVKLKALLESRGQRVFDDHFVCFGGWNFLRRGHPNDQDAKAARKWARKIVNDIR